MIIMSIAGTPLDPYLLRLTIGAAVWELAVVSRTPYYLDSQSTMRIQAQIGENTTGYRVSA